MGKKNISLTEKQESIVKEVAKEYGLTETAAIRLIIEKFAELKVKLIG